MLTPLLMCLQFAFTNVPSVPCLPVQVETSDLLVRLKPIRDDVLLLLEHLREKHSSLRSLTGREPIIAQGTPFSPLVDEMEQYADYYEAYLDAQDAVVGAMHHAFYYESPSCSATKERVLLEMEGDYVPGVTFLVSTYPAANGVAATAGTSGGVATAQPLVLLPTSQNYTSPGGAPFVDRPLHYYSAVLTSGFQHSGMALQLESAGQPTLVLYPDAILGTSVFTPGDLATLRWVLSENPTLQSSLVMESLLGPFTPPVWQAGGPQNGVLRQDTLSAYLCCRAALEEWKNTMTENMLYANEWQKAITNASNNATGQLNRELEATLGPGTTLDLYHDDLIPVELGSPQYEATKNTFRDRKREIDDRRRTDEENLKNFLLNSNVAANNKLYSKLLDCLSGWPEGSLIAYVIYVRAAQLIP